ncbi:MAG: BON domain-containing protein, partial [Bradyrhizobium sp.]|nr:BON domain-containing protein [Bradyrhizobium sp.]
PIVSRDGDLVGIVSRANLIQVIASARPKLEMTLPDAAIRQKLLDEMKRQPWAHRYNLSVTVAGGVVDLWGYAQSDDERRAIRVAAEAVPGVVLVNDHLADSPVFAY